MHHHNVTAIFCFGYHHTNNHTYKENEDNTTVRPIIRTHSDARTPHVIRSPFSSINHCIESIIILFVSTCQAIQSSSSARHLRHPYHLSPMSHMSYVIAFCHNTAPRTSQPNIVHVPLSTPSLDLFLPICVALFCS